jgi:hypothetical protein
MLSLEEIRTVATDPCSVPDRSGSERQMHVPGRGPDFAVSTTVAKLCPAAKAVNSIGHTQNGTIS